MGDDNLQLYEVSISQSATMYVLAEDEDEARKIAEDEGDEAFFMSHIEVDEVEEINDIKDVGPSERKDNPYGKSKLTIEQWFAERDSADPDEPTVSLAELEAAGQLRLLTLDK